MKSKVKTKAALIDEIKELRLRINELENVSINTDTNSSNTARSQEFYKNILDTINDPHDLWSKSL